jgi:antitoxin (DNA-binding transcriptional repressor) of toxin-antitoxin stability system
MKSIEIDDATASLSEYAQGLDDEPLVLTVDGKPVAALVAIENADMETVTLSSHPQFLAIIERSRKRHKAEGGVSVEEIRCRLDLPRIG